MGFNIHIERKTREIDVIFMDYKKLNKLRKTDPHLIPRIDDCIDTIGNATYIKHCDLLTYWYWAVPLTDSAKPISYFITPSGSYQY